MRLLLCSVGLAVCPVLAVCQRPVPAQLSLADAITLARANNPLYRQAINDRAPAAWAARSAWSTMLGPSVSASGGIGYAGPGQQTFLTSNFSQSVSTLSSSYGFGLDWSLSGQTLTQPGLRKAQLSAADADVAGAETNLVTTVTQQYLTVLQARDNGEVARQQLQHDEEFQKLAQARYDVGRASLIDVRQAQVARGQAQVVLLRARTAVQVEKFRLFQQMGVTAPVDLAAVQLTDTFKVEAPTWQLNDLLTMAQQQNPALKALREREHAAAWASGPRPRATVRRCRCRPAGRASPRSYRTSTRPSRARAPARRRTRPRARTPTARGSTGARGNPRSTARCTPSAPRRSRRSATATPRIRSTSRRSRSRRGLPCGSRCGATSSSRSRCPRPRPSSRTFRSRCERAACSSRPR